MLAILACRMAPSKDCLVQPTHALVVCRPTNISSHSYEPLAVPPSPAELKLQEALATWVGPQLPFPRSDEWQLEVTPVSTFDAVTAAKQWRALPLGLPLLLRPTSASVGKAQRTQVAPGTAKSARLSC